MSVSYILIPVLVVFVTVTYGVSRAMAGVWVQHRVKLALLEKYENQPELFDSSREIGELVEKQERASKPSSRQDYAVTGVLLAAIGLGCIAVGRFIAVGTLAVGIYVGGITCVVLGIVIALFGILIRSLSKNTLAEPVKG